MEFGGCTVFLMIPGYGGAESAKRAALQYKLSMREAGKERDKDFERLLGLSQYITPFSPHQVHLMFDAIVRFLEQLAGGPCIAQIGYALAAELVKLHGKDIDHFMKNDLKNHFLLRLLVQVNRECQFMFQYFYNDIKLAGASLYQVDPDQMLEMKKQITKIFDRIKRGGIWC